MTEGAVWWLTLEAIGLASFPIAFSFFRFLPDRGYAFAKVLGLLLMSYILWIGATAHVIPNERWSILLILVVMAAASAALAWRARSQIAQFLREHWLYALLVEALFVAVFAGALWLRSFQASGDVFFGEKPMEFAFLNAIMRSDQFPPYDPWFSGHDLAYYYYGFLVMATLMKLTAVPVSVGFNLALALTIGLSAACVFGLVYNLLAGVASRAVAILLGFVGVGLLTVLGNLEGLLELLAVHGWIPGGVLDWIGIEGLNDSLTTSEWYPTETFWWVRARHIPTSWDIKEFPFWSYQLGDLHPHVIVIPFTLVAAAAALNLLRCAGSLDIGWVRRHPAPFLLTALALGSLGFLHLWSLPPLLLTFAAVVLMHNLRRGEAVVPALRDSFVFGTVLFAVALIAYLPYYLFSRGESWPLVPLEASARPNPKWHSVSNPVHLFIVWAPLLWLAFGLVIAAVEWRWVLRLRWRALLAVLVVAVPFGFWIAMVISDLGLDGLLDEARFRGASWVSLVLLMALCTLAVLGLARRGGVREKSGLDESTAFVLVLTAVALLSILGPEWFFVRDFAPGSRTNTVFKLYHQAWVLLSVVGAFSMFFVLRALRWPQAVSRWAKPVWLAVGSLLVLAGLAFPLMVAFSRTYEFRGAQAMDSLTPLRNGAPGRYESVQWLNDNVKGTPLVLHAVYLVFAEWEPSQFTGLPTVLGIAPHEIEWRGSEADVSGRQADVERVYSSTSAGEAAEVIRKYGVEYVYVGPIERQVYGAQGVAKFAAFMDVAYQNQDVTIYRVRE